MDSSIYTEEPEEDVEFTMELRPSRRWTEWPSSDNVPLRRGATVDSLNSYHSRGRYTLNVPLFNPETSHSGRTRPTIEKKLCEFCTETIITTDLTWGLHHPNHESLQQSVAEQCTLCCKLASDIDDQRLDDVTKISWPIHRWNIRGPQRIDDSENVYATLIFREAASIRHMMFVGDSVNLPQRAFYLFQQSDPARMQSLRPLGNHTHSEQTQNMIQDWISDCDKNHVNCAGRADKDFVPTRLLDLDYREDRVLVVQARANGVRKPYTTVSYSWGLNSFVRLTADNIGLFMKEGIVISTLPKTIQEAIEITRMLGIQYIWIDSLCIIQGSAGDFQFEASLMLQVYRNCLVNLAASDTTSADDGLFRYRLEEELFDAECQGRPNSKILGNGIWRVVPKAFWDDQVLDARLNNRGWVFQERLLSPRILHFAKKQVFWDCATVSACETFREGLPQPLDTGSNDRYWRWKLQDSSDLNMFLPAIVDQSLEQFWRNAIHTYSMCQLTRSSDKLIAIWGIVRFLIGALRERYAVGLWERNLEEQLAWHVVDCQSSTRFVELDAPSWSWATIHGEIILPDRFAAVRDYHVVDHYGQNITFDLHGSTRDQNHGPRTWTEQLKQYEARVKEIDEYRQGKVLPPPPMLSEQEIDMSPIPGLRTRSIPIMGFIGRMYLRKAPQGQNWILEHLLGHDAIQAFPDVQPDPKPVGLGHTLYLILASSIVYPGTPRRQGIPTWANRCDGVGLLIDFRGGNRRSSGGHFVRTGAFHFNDVDISRMFGPNLINDPAELGIDSAYDSNKGFKIWLD